MRDGDQTQVRVDESAGESMRDGDQTQARDGESAGESMRDGDQTQVRISLVYCHPRLTRA